MEEILFGEQSLIIWLTVTFVVLLVLLRKFAYGPILDTLDKRSQHIQDALDQAEKLKTDADTMFAEYSKQLENAKKEANKIVEQGKKISEQIKQEMVEKAKEQSSNLIRQAENEIENKKEEALKELRQNVAMLSVSVAEKVLKKSIDEKEHRRLLEDSMEEVGRLSGKN